MIRYISPNGIYRKTISPHNNIQGKKKKKTNNT